MQNERDGGPAAVARLSSAAALLTTLLLPIAAAAVPAPLEFVEIASQPLWPEAVAVTADGTHVYVLTNRNDDTDEVMVLARDSVTGSVTFLPGAGVTVANASS